MGLTADLSDGRARLLEAALRTCQGVGLGPATQDGGADPNTRRCSAHLRKAWAQKGGLSGRPPVMSMISARQEIGESRRRPPSTSPVPIYTASGTTRSN